MVLISLGEMFKNPVDKVFFGAIAAALVLILVIFVISKVTQASKDKKYEKEFLAKKAEEAPEVLEEVPAVEETPVVEEEVPTVEETPVVEEEVPTVEETPVVEEEVPTVEETPVVEEKAPVKKVTPKKAPVKKTAPVKEEAPAEEAKAKGRTYNGKYEYYQSGDGYQYRLKASNGEVLIVSEVYTSKDGVLKAIDAVKRNVETGEIRIIEDKHGMFKFKLTSKNHRVVALGSNYSTEKSAVRASESFKKFALKADIVEIEVTDVENSNATPIDLGQVEDKNGGKYVVEKFNGEFSWGLRATNGQVLCQANGYTSKSGALNSIETFKKNVATGSFKIIKDKNGNYHFNLYSTSGRVAAIGETYSSKQLAESAANSVASFSKNAEVVEKLED